MNKPYVGVIQHQAVQEVFNYIKDDLRKRLKPFEGNMITKDVGHRIKKTIFDFCTATLDKHLYGRILFVVRMKDDGMVEICPRNLVTGMFMVGVPLGFLMLVKDGCKEITVDNTNTRFDGCKFAYTVENGFSYQPKKPAELVDLVAAFDCFDSKEEL